MTTQILEIDSLRKTYGKGNNQTKALNGITFQVMAGEFLGIMGSSGSGKSTLLNCIATVIRPTWMPFQKTSPLGEGAPEGGG